MIVELPDGTTIDRIPEGTSKADLAKKLRANGRNVPDEWLKGASTDANDQVPITGDPAKDREIRAQLKAERESAAAHEKELDDSSIGKKLLGAGDAALTVGTGIASAIPRAVSSIYGGDISDKVGDMMTWHPRTELGKRYVGNVGQAVEKSGIGDLPPTMGGITNSFAPLGAAAAPTLAKAAKYASPIATLAPISKKAGEVISAIPGVEKAGEALGKIKGKIPGPSDLFGKPAAKARNEAAEVAKGAVKASAEDQAGIAQNAELKAQALEDTSGKLAGQAKLPETADLSKQGEGIRGAFSAKIEEARTARTAKADTMFQKARDAAAAKEASGQRIDVTEAKKSIDKMLEQSQGIPDLHRGLANFSSAIGEVGPNAKTFEQMELTRRYLNDIAYGADVEGYSAIIRNEAKDAAKAIDKAMGEFVPEFQAYKDTYKKMSEPLESLGTKIGNAITGTEGGGSDRAYSKVAAQDLPGKIFAKKEGIDLMVDALAGGKNAEPAARAAAQATVNDMVVNWITESSSAKTPQAMLQHILTPQVRATLSNNPQVYDALKQQFTRLSGLVNQSDELKNVAKQLRTTGSAAQANANKMKTSLDMAESLAKQPGKKAQADAYSEYVKALNTARKANFIPPEKYEAAITMIDRASTMEEKTALARKIALGIGVSAVGIETGKVLLGK
jgi:hypothetical protein